VLQVKLDGQANARVAVDSKFYKHIDYGYATTVHKAQGTTVDKTYVLATAHFDRHTSYVALSRHRESATVFFASDDFGGRAPGATADAVKERFLESLSRARAKELAHDYLEREPSTDSALLKALVAHQWQKDRCVENTDGPRPTDPNDLDAKQQAGAERWANRQRQGPTPAGQGAERTTTRNPTPTPTKDRAPELRRDGPEDDLEL